VNPDVWSVFAIAGVALAVIAWALWPRDDYRSRNDRRVARRLFEDEPPNRETQPGSNDDDLLTCLHILAATNNARKEDRP
jgi:cbb3-type cytochrome oxidase subunit 3